MSNEPCNEDSEPDHLPRDDGEDRIVAALDYLGRSAARDGKASWQTASSWQEACLEKWAEGLGLLLDLDDFASRVVRGGQEHDLIIETDRYVKVTRSGVFGLTPGIDLALVADGNDARRFHLWEATPAEYLERLLLQNELTPGLNSLLGVLSQPTEMSLVISQPRFDLNAVTEAEIDRWFLSLGFDKVTSAAYYREGDNLGVFDAHDKNVVKASIDPEVLIPFDVIPVHPDGGFLDFIKETIASGNTLSVVRTTRTSSRAGDAENEKG